MTYEEMKAEQNRVLRFSCLSTCTDANERISHRMSLDYKQTIKFSEPQEDETGWCLPDPIYQTDTEEQYNAYMDGVLDYEAAVLALLEVVE